MEEKHIHQLIQNLIERFEYLGEDQFILDKELEELSHPITKGSIPQEAILAIENGLLEKIQYKRSYDGAVLIPVSVVSDPKDHEEWYDVWLSSNNDDIGSYYWKRLENFLSTELTQKYGAENAGQIVRSIDEATFEIMKKLANPLRNEFSYKGLVVGYVQSGKTANFTSLIAKAADAGYNFIIVLAGIHNVLRRQTQVRLDRELTGERDLEGPDNYISLPGVAKSWKRLTTAHNDFSTANLSLFESLCQMEITSLAIVKKNVSVLNRLINYIERASVDLRANLSVLVIDDEADQASVDTNSNNPETDPSRTNECIRNLLGLFTKKAYVGYTATPFANVLIDMATEHHELQDDLYPRNFIVSLPEPRNYFGTSLIFKGDLSNRFIVEISPKRIDNNYVEARELLRNRQLTYNLSLAIDQFILSCAVRNLRNDRMEPMSMLVHVSHRISDMETVADLINNYSIGNEGYIQVIIGRYQDKHESELLKKQYKLIWKQFSVDSVFINHRLSTSNVVPEFDDIWKELSNVFDVLQVMTLNSASEDSLDYTTGKEIKVIAIGGNQLSRGLTLEGLMTSYYLRASRQYDTLLQMGRWFGYRKNYEDLTRIHTTTQIWEYFTHLTQVEEELRRDIKRYEGTDNTPSDLALTILTHSRLSVTARNKLGAADIQQTSYSDSLHQTFKFPINLTEKIRSNLNLGAAFITKISETSIFSESWVKGTYVSKKTYSSTYIFDNFVDRYNFEERFNGSGIDLENLRSYVHRRSSDNELQNWRVALAGNTKNNLPVTLGGQTFNKINRSRLINNEGYDCGVITDKKHLMADLSKNVKHRSEGRGVNQALLILYIINSKSKGEKIGRVDLYHDIYTEKIDVLGFAIVLPKSERETYDRIGQ
jgi:Z1 domain